MSDREEYRERERGGGGGGERKRRVWERFGTGRRCFIVIESVSNFIFIIKK